MRIFPALVFMILVSAPGRAQNLQSWDEVDLTASWDKVKLLVPLLIRVDSHLPNPQLAATGFTVDLPGPWHLTMTAGYLFADLPRRSQIIHVPLVAVSKSFHLHRFTFVDRNRFEKLVGSANSPVRYRNRTMLDRPFGHDDRWHVFVDDEIFLDLSAAQWNQNRFQFGVGARVTSASSVDTYYLIRSAPGGAPLTHVAGVTLKAELKKSKKTE